MKEEKEQNEANKTTKTMQKDLYILEQPFEDTTNMKRGENETMDRWQIIIRCLQNVLLRCQMWL